MRIHVYDEEVTSEVALVTKTADTGLAFHGARLFLASPDVLHATPTDDDRSAITFWWEIDNESERLKVRGAIAGLLDAIDYGTLNPTGR